MTDRPIIFSAPMVLALLDGRKTMTRRLAWKDFKAAKERDRAKLERVGCIFERRGGTSPGYGSLFAAPPSPWQRVQPGDRLWVREGWKPHSLYDAMKPRDIPPSKIFYLADEAYSPSGSRGRPSIHMPRAFSRLTLIVTATKIERLQEITNASCIAEGAEIEDVPGGSPDGQPMVRIDGKSWHHQTVRLWYHRLWDTLHGEGAWDENPEVVEVSFTVHKQNIDAIAEAA